METETQLQSASARLLEQALSQKPVLPVSESSVEKARALLQKQGIPEVKNERYKYANVAKILNEGDFINAEVGASDAETFAKNLSFYSGKNILVTVNGLVSRFEAGEGISLSGIGEYLAFQPKIQLEENDSMQALALLSARNGFHLRISAPTAEPLVWLNIVCSGEQAVYGASLNVIEVAAGIEAEITEIRIGSGKKAFSNQLSQVKLGEHAQLKMAVSDQNMGQSSGIFSLLATQEKGSTFSHSILATGAQFLRQNISAEHLAENCHTELNGFYAADKDRHSDFLTTVKHMFPNCTSDELYKGLAADRSTAVFNGKVYVARDAQKTNAYQSNKNILLSDEALIRSKPELEIYADDVKCSHGSTTGQTDLKSLFYLQSRGIREKEAKKMLMLAFAGDVLDRISNEDTRSYLAEIAENKLQEILQ